MRRPRDKSPIRIGKILLASTRDIRIAGRWCHILGRIGGALRWVIRALRRIPGTLRLRGIAGCVGSAPWSACSHLGRRRVPFLHHHRWRHLLLLWVLLRWFRIELVLGEFLALVVCELFVVADAGAVRVVDHLTTASVSSRKKQSRLEVRKYSFPQRTINVCNKLSTDCVHASSVTMFKNKIDKYLVKAGYT